MCLETDSEEKIYSSGIRFSARVVDKMTFLFNNVSNFQCNSMTGVVKFCTSGTLVKKKKKKKHSINFFIC